MAAPLKGSEPPRYNPPGTARPENGGAGLPIDEQHRAHLENVLGIVGVSKPTPQNDRLLALAIQLLDLTILEGAFIDEKCAEEGLSKRLVGWAHAYTQSGRSMGAINAEAAAAQEPQDRDPSGGGGAEGVDRKPEGPRPAQT